MRFERISASNGLVFVFICLLLQFRRLDLFANDIRMISAAAGATILLLMSVIAVILLLLLRMVTAATIAVVLEVTVVVSAC